MKDLLELTEKLIGFDTVSSKDNSNCTQFIADRLDSAGMSLKIFEDVVDGVPKSQILATMGPDRDRSGLILSGHVDVVPYDNQPGWTKDPLKMEVTDKDIFGRGTTDMKVFIAQAIRAAETVDKNRLQSQLVLLFTCDEEICCQGAKRLIPKLEDYLIDSALPSQALIGEPTNFKVFHAHKGIGNIRLFTQGKGGHSSRPDLGKNAITDMAKVLLLLEELNQEFQSQASPNTKSLFGDHPASSFNAGVISGGVARNMIPEQCFVDISMRTTPDLEADEMLDRLDKKIAAQKLDVKWDIRDKKTAPALNSRIDSELHKHLKQWSGHHQNQGASFATDAGYFAQLNIESYICGPGLLSQAHQANESIPLENVQGGVNLIEVMVQKLVY